MEHAEASSDTSGWTSFGSSVPTEDPEIMALLFSNTSIGGDDSQSWQCFDSFHPYHQEPPQPYYGPGDGQSGAYYWPQGCGGGPAPLVPNPETENFYCNFDANVSGDYSAALTMDFFVGDNEKSNPAAQENLGSLSEEPAGFAGKGGGLKFLELASPTLRKPSGKRRMPVVPDSDKALADDEKEPSAALNPKKKSKSTADLQKTGKSNGQARKGQKGAAKAALSEDTGLVRQSSCSDSSEDDSIASQELGDAGASSSSKVAVKTRAGRGSATDPQSLYARKRRERINERLKILQNLVPNGTKVDISTMLEEAVQYVKFLQLQIKLLSSDDLWMYAPIAYNGMDIGLNLKIAPPQ